MLATLGAFALLRGVALLLMAGARRRLPHSRNVVVRLAVANVHRPGALTPSVVLSLGLGPSALLVSLTLIDGNIRNQLAPDVARRDAESFFFIDIQSPQAAGVRGFSAGNRRGDGENRPRSDDARPYRRGEGTAGERRSSQRTAPPGPCRGIGASPITDGRCRPDRRSKAANGGRPTTTGRRSSRWKAIVADGLGLKRRATRSP